jgi:hypothetical protein
MESAYAVLGGLECLKYVHENGCAWDEGTCMSAAFTGELECLRYIIFLCLPDFFLLFYYFDNCFFILFYFKVCT